MKKFLILFACVIALSVLAGCGGDNTSGGDSDGTYSSSEGSNDMGDIGSDIMSDVESGMSGSNQSATTAASGAQITSEQAATVALGHAGLTDSDVQNIRVELERDDGVLKYEVDFYKSNVEYNYDIDALTGEILSYDRDVD